MLKHRRHARDSCWRTRSNDEKRKKRSNVKRALHSVKRALYSVKRALVIAKRAAKETAAGGDIAMTKRESM